MPCAAAELCLISNLTPKAPDGHQCRGGCGGRLHGICGEVEEEGESEINRLCPACYSSKQASTAAAGKRKAEDAGKPLNLDITPGKPAADTSVLVAQTWALVEDQEDVVEAVRSDQAEDVAAVLKGLPVEGDESSDSEDEEDDEDESMGGGGAEPPPYAELSQHFAPLESYAAGCGLNEASYLLKRARMLMIKAHASKPSRQADVREFFDA